MVYYHGYEIITTFHLTVVIFPDEAVCIRPQLRNSPFPQYQATNILVSAFFSSEWSHVVFVLFQKLLSLMSSGSVHIVACIRAFLLLRLNNISLLIYHFRKNITYLKKTNLCSGSLTTAYGMGWQQ